MVEISILSFWIIPSLELWIHYISRRNVTHLKGRGEGTGKKSSSESCPKDIRDGTTEVICLMSSSVTCVPVSASLVSLSPVAQHLAFLWISFVFLLLSLSYSCQCLLCSGQHRLLISAPHLCSCHLSCFPVRISPKFLFVSPVFPTLSPVLLSASHVFFSA